MAIIVTYDVPSRHTELKQRLFSLGYADRIVDNGRYIYFPNTTVYHANKTASNGRDDVQAICNQLGVRLERCVSTQWGPDWAAIYGDAFAQ